LIRDAAHIRSTISERSAAARNGRGGGSVGEEAAAAASAWRGEGSVGEEEAAASAIGGEGVGDVQVHQAECE